MSNRIRNLIVLTVFLFVAAGVGGYITLVKQPQELERLTKAEQVARLKQAELSSLVAEMGDSESQASNVVARWNARYKLIPREMGSEEVIRFLNTHTGKGFHPFNISFEGFEETASFNRYDFLIEGQGSFRDVYELIWVIENSRQLYRVEDLELRHMDLVSDDPTTGRQRLDMVVEFSFELSAFFGGAVGLSASDSTAGAPMSMYFSDADVFTDLPPVPEEVLPRRSPRMNPFEPLILENMPPNTLGLVDLESAELISIVGPEAILKWNGGEYKVSVGDPVYLGEVISVDPIRGRVVASLNKGGIPERIELIMDLDDFYNKARGNVQLTPAKNY